MPPSVSIVLSRNLYATLLFFFFFNDTATTEIYTLSLHDALPISYAWMFILRSEGLLSTMLSALGLTREPRAWCSARSEEHTSELQSQSNLVCRLLLEKKKKNRYINRYEQLVVVHYR